VQQPGGLLVGGGHLADQVLELGELLDVEAADALGERADLAADAADALGGLLLRGPGGGPRGGLAAGDMLLPGGMQGACGMRKVAG